VFTSAISDNETRYEHRHPKVGISNSCGSSTGMILKDENHPTTTGLHVKSTMNSMELLRYCL